MCGNFSFQKSKNVGHVTTLSGVEPDGHNGTALASSFSRRGKF
jgi:hypothetical protein